MTTITMTAGAPISAGQVVRTTGSPTRAIPATEELRALSFLGVATTSALAGAPVDVQLDGLYGSLGSGVACAVGVTAGGTLVRATSSDCRSAPNWLGTCDRAGNVTVAPRREAHYDVRDFGAVGDGATDDLPAFDACQDAMRLQDPVEGRGGIFYVPPTDPAVPGDAYFLDGEFELLAQAIYRGGGTGGFSGAARIKFAAGKGFRVHSAQTSPRRIGGATDAVIEGFDIQCQALPFRTRMPSTTYDVDEVVRCPCASGVDTPDVGNGEYIVHYRCIHPGETSPVARDYWTEGAQAVDTSLSWSEVQGQSVKYGTVVRSSDPSHANVFFMNREPPLLYENAVAGASEPAWNYAIGSETTDSAGRKWTCVSSAGAIVVDGSAVFSVRTSAAIFSMTACTIERNSIVGCLGPAIHVVGNILSTPPSASSRSRILENDVTLPRLLGDDLVSVNHPDGRPWGGVGYAVHGGDANAFLFQGNRVTGGATLNPTRVSGRAYAAGDRVRLATVPLGDAREFVNFECVAAGTAAATENLSAFAFPLGTLCTDGGVQWKAIRCTPEYGYFDRSFVGNRHWSDFAEECAGPGFALLASAASGHTSGCYSECYVPDIYHGPQSLLGGTPRTPIIRGGGMSITPAGGVNVRQNSLGGARASTAWLARQAGVSGPLVLDITSDDDSAGAGLNRDGLAPGWWHHLQASSVLRPSYGYSTGHARDGDLRQYGPNVFNIPRALLFGAPNVLERSFMWFASPEDSRRSGLLGCYRRVGDRRSKDPTSAAPGGYLDEVVVTAGYEAPAWQPLTVYQQGIPVGTDGANPPDVVRSSASAYRCIRTGVSGSTEPNWALAPALGDELDDPNGSGARWRNVGGLAAWKGCNQVAP